MVLEFSIQLSPCSVPQKLGKKIIDFLFDYSIQVFLLNKKLTFIYFFGLEQLSAFKVSSFKFLNFLKPIEQK